MSPALKISAIIIAIVMICLKPSDGAFFKKVYVKWAVQKNSSLTINGSSNVNKFQCGISGYYQPDTISFNASTPNIAVPLKGALTIDIEDLDCRNRMITKDLRKTLKADDYPKLVIRFIALERAPSYKDNRDLIRAAIEVELAGICKRFEIPFELIKRNSCSIELNGVKEFSFADFKLAPPKKIAGLVKVNDRFTVNFNLQLNQVAG